MSRSAPPDAPGAPVWLQAAAAAALSKARKTWRGWPVHDSLLSHPRATGSAASPRDLRPPLDALGQAVLVGRFPLGGTELDVGPGGDPWDGAGPSRPFAVQLHRFVWMPALLSQGIEASREALRLTLAWRALFDRPASFGWGADVLERRVFHLACALSALAATASEREAEALQQMLARQARALAGADSGPARRAERWAVVAVAGCALAGRAGDRLLGRALPALGRALEANLHGDGGLRTRSPEQGMELWFDLATLDDALAQRGRRPPFGLGGALDRLAGATRFFRLADGRLAAFHGGGGSSARRVAAARPEDASLQGTPYQAAPHSGFHRLEGRRLTLMVDAASPPAGPWSVAACAQPCAFEATGDGERLIVGSGWTPDAAASASLRLGPAASTLTLADASPGRLLSAGAARWLGPRLQDASATVEVRRETGQNGVLLELEHDGWAVGFGLTHMRRLFLDVQRDELRGEDRLTPADPGREPNLGLACVRFHLAPGVRASVARDRRSVLLRAASDRAWWLRNDASEVRLEPSVRVDDGVERRTLQIVLGAPVTPEGARVRWKLSPVEAAPPPAPGATAIDLPSLRPPASEVSA